MKSGLTHAGGWEAGAFSIPSIDGDPVILNIFLHFSHRASWRAMSSREPGKRMTVVDGGNKKQCNADGAEMEHDV